MKDDALEREVESYLRRRVVQMGGDCVKIDTVRGYPDRIVLLPGDVHFLVETKRPVGGRLSPDQKVQHIRLRRMGHTVFVAKDKAEVDAVLRKYGGA